MDKIRSRAHFVIHPGKLEEFKQLSARCMSRARALDVGTLSYEIFFNADESECVVYEEYADSQASIDHFENMGELSAAIFAIVDATGETWGDPSPALRKALEEHGVRIFKPYLSLSAKRDEKAQG